MHADCPLKDIACVLFAQTKDATIVCVIGCQITRTRIHTLLERLASARHDNKGKLYPTRMHVFFKQTVSWRRRKADDVCSRWSFYYGSTGSDVMGCRRPTGGVFTYVSSDRVTLRAFPVATPRGRSSSSHEGELRFADPSLTSGWLTQHACFSAHFIDYQKRRALMRKWKFK